MILRTVVGALALVATSGFPAIAASAPMVGEVGTIGTAGQDASHGWPCTDTKDNMHAMSDAVGKHDEDGYREAVANAVVLMRGTKVRVLEREGFPFYLDVKVRILTGENAHIACWIEADVPELWR